MPQINDSTPVEQRDLTGRRLMAGAIDGLLVVTGTALVGLMKAERFPIVERMNGRPVFSVTDQARINEIDEGFNRAIRLGDRVLTLSGGGWWLTMATLIALTALLFVILPTPLRRRTPGRLAMRLPRRTDLAPTHPVEILSVTEVGPERAMIEPDPAPSLAPHRVPAPTSATLPPLPTRMSPATAGHRSPASVDDHARPSVDLTDRTEGAAIDLDLAVDREQPPADDDRPAWTSARSSSSRFSTVSPGRGGVRTIERLAAPQPAKQITLADADDYLVWDRLEAARARTAEDPDRDGGADDLTIEPDGTPLWSEDWEAWLYHDPATSRWFRYEQRTETWLPID